MPLSSKIIDNGKAISAISCKNRPTDFIVHHFPTNVLPSHSFT
jgi:hypothetical protein